LALVTVVMVGVMTQPARVTQPSLRRLGASTTSRQSSTFHRAALVNATLNANPAINEARTRVPRPGSSSRDGPCLRGDRRKCAYRPAMKESHEKMNITQAEWDAMVTDFKATLDKFKVPQREQQELITIVDSTKNDIVRSSSSGSRQ
jgi:hemoglobin